MSDIGAKKDIFDEIGINSWHFAKVFREVFSKVTGLELVADMYDPDEGGAFNSQISGIVVLTGDKAIIISVGMSYRTAAILVENMTGMQHGEMRLDDQCDGVCELLNMIAGQTKAKLTSLGYHYRYMQPFSIAGDNHHIIQKNNVSSLNMKFRAGAVELVMTVSIL